MATVEPRGKERQLPTAQATELSLDEAPKKSPVPPSKKRRRKKRKKVKKHRKFWLVVKIFILIILLSILGVGLFLYFKYGDVRHAG